MGVPASWGGGHQLPMWLPFVNLHANVKGSGPSGGALRVSPPGSANGFSKSISSTSNPPMQKKPHSFPIFSRLSI